MDFNKKTVKDIDIAGKRVLLRVDYNVPIKAGKIQSDFRIQESLPTINYLLEQGCSIVIMSHLGRPDGKPNKEYSLKPTAERLASLTKKDVKFADDCLGSATEKQVKELNPGDILMLENVRFYAEEEACDKKFAEKLSKYGEVFVQDCFGVAHRAHASVAGIAEYLPAVAGFLLEKEVTTILGAMKQPKRPLMAIVGGAKISDKIKVLKRFIEISDFVAIGGAMANTFLLAKGIKTGNSLAEPDDIPLAKEIMELAAEKAKQSNFVFYLPQDGVVATDLENPDSTRIVDWDTNAIADIEAYPKQPNVKSQEVGDDEKILDIGPFSASFIAGGIQLVETVVWNGTLGVAEVEGKSNDPVGPFAHGTDIVMEALLGHYGRKPFVIVGGGDTAGYVEDRGLTKAFNHVSTGGGASLELMEGKDLPGVSVLLDKET